MSITERTLKKWRGEALNVRTTEQLQLSLNCSVNKECESLIIISQFIEFRSRILRLTQELLDQHLLRK